jgi:hypothetical protein
VGLGRGGACASGQAQGLGLTHRLLLLQPQLARAASQGAGAVPQGAAVVDDAAAVSAALELSLARNLCLAGSCAEALALYQKLEGEGVLSSSSSSGISGGAGGAGDSGSSTAWLCYGHAALQCGQQQLGVRALQAAIDSAPDGATQLAGVNALLQVRAVRGLGAMRGVVCACRLALQRRLIAAPNATTPRGA